MGDVVLAFIITICLRVCSMCIGLSEPMTNYFQISCVHVTGGMGCGAAVLVLTRGQRVRGQSTHTGCGSRGRRAGRSLMETEKRGEHTQHTELSLPPSINSFLPSFLRRLPTWGAPVSTQGVSYGLEQVAQGVSRSISMPVCMCMSLNGKLICVCVYVRVWVKWVTGILFLNELKKTLGD